LDEAIRKVLFYWDYQMLTQVGESLEELRKALAVAESEEWVR
jgi:hypothetical protein